LVGLALIVVIGRKQRVGLGPEKRVIVWVVVPWCRVLADGLRVLWWVLVEVRSLIVIDIRLRLFVVV
jgi:hypothetical protein